jgi:hypothetical protein
LVYPIQSAVVIDCIGWLKLALRPLVNTSLRQSAMYVVTNGRNFYKVDWGFFRRRAEWRNRMRILNKRLNRQSRKDRWSFKLYPFFEEYLPVDFDIPARYPGSPTDFATNVDEKYNNFIDFKSGWNKRSHRLLTPHGGPCGFARMMRKVRRSVRKNGYWEPPFSNPEELVPGR